MTSRFNNPKKYEDILDAKIQIILPLLHIDLILRIDFIEEVPSTIYAKVILLFSKITIKPFSTFGNKNHGCNL